MATFTANSNGIYAKLVVTEQSQSVANNTTTLLWEIYMWNTTAKPNWYMYDQHNIFQVKINGEYVLNNSDFGRVSLQYEQPESAARLITSGTYTIAHNSDGTKTGVPVYLYAAQGWEYAYVWETSGTMNLTTIARASQPSLSASSITLGSAVTIYTNRASSSFTHTLEYSIGSASGTIASGVGTSQSWTPSKELARQFPNATSGVVTITCKTYNGSTLIGTKQTFLTINISSDMIPSVSATISEAASIPSGISGYIKTRSKLRIVASASGSYGSTIMSYKITANGATYNASEATTGYLTTAGSNTITVTVTDSRGQSKTYSTTVTVLDYSPPRIDSLNAYRCNSSGTADAEGAYLKIEFTGTITSLNSKNSRTAYVQTRPSGGSWSTQGYALGSGYSGFTGYTAVLSAATTTSYEVRVQVADSFGSSSFYTTTVSTASILMNILSDKSGMAIGKMAEKAKTVQLGWDLETHGALNALKGVSTSAIINNKMLGATLNTVGWYRIYTSVGSDANGEGTVNFTLSHNYSHSNQEVFDFSVSVGYAGQINITQVSGVRISGAIAKIRVVHGYPNVYYIDFYYGANSSNTVWVHGSGCGTFCAPTAASVPDGYSTIEFDLVTGCKSSSGFTGNLNGDASSANGVIPEWSGYIAPSETNWLAAWKSDGTKIKAMNKEDLVVGWARRSLNPSVTTVNGTTYTVDTYLTLVSNAITIATTGYYTWNHSWSYAGNGLLSASIGGVNHVIQLAGAHCELSYRDANNYILRITTATTSGTDGASFVKGATYVYNTHGSAYSPTWTIEQSVAARGTSGIWTYVKYNDGIAMCWGNTAICNTAFTATWGNWYIHDYLFPAQRFPFDFVEIPKVFASQGKHGTTACEWSWYSGGEVTTQYTPRYSVFRPATTGATVNLSLNLFAIGRWK